MRLSDFGVTGLADVRAEIVRQADLTLHPVPLSFRDVEDFIAERGIAMSYETIRRWLKHFGPIIAAELQAPSKSAFRNSSQPTPPSTTL